MIKPEQIPDEVVEAAVAMRDRGGSMSDIIRTAINAWPGVIHNGHWLLFPHTKLPLPTENTND